MDESVNPYAPPQIGESPDAAKPAFMPRLSRPYQSAHGKTLIVSIATIAVIVANLILVVSCAMQWSMLVQAQGGGQLDPATAEANDMRQNIVSGLVTMTALCCFVCLLVWIYAVHANLPSLAGQKLEFTSGWAVGWFFVPIANLVKPYQAIVEVWKNSDPAPLHGLPAAPTALIGWWWGLRIGSAVVERVFGFAARESSTIDSLMIVSCVAIVVTLVVDIPMLLCQLFLVRKVQRMQDDRYALVSKQNLESGATVNPWSQFQ